MKKMMLIALSLMGSVLCCAKEKLNTDESTISICTSDPQCVDVGNVSMSVSTSSGQVTFINHNDFPVNVTWTVWGAKEDGTEVRCGGGTVYLQPEDKDGQILTRRFDKRSDCESYYVTGSSKRCN